MMDVVEILPSGSFEIGAADKVVLDHDHRLRRRIVLSTLGGKQVRLYEAKPVQLRDGDGLRLSDGTLVLVVAQPEPLLEITASSLGELIRIAWHLGNRHLPTQLLGDKLRIRQDHVIADMIKGLGGQIITIRAPFDPEGGAYAGGHHAHEPA